MQQTGRPSARHAIILFDEVESHLHPRWQRSILRSLEEANSTIFSRPFEKPMSGRVAVKVINHLGDEVMKVVKV